ncbi:hypothetical protein A2382_02730 [Candidatus Woesebacteria bacterium RIFOXYB1_FULL_38_16]|uniref:SpoVT-AbrB domain-containing protein n=1 Tax=Candidatus Woesebacteria bacterium RIFOXYB1_FULL_38_16 TaxID=1802538 RepID=A0A1F8CSS9_9BACT|nr:MAG: hypothetical protein A2382_02730 [Candidatus Woesebacteria bacterium RIFOXYB1_FULL_38_16]
MIYTVSITEQGQITIPKKIRNELNLNKKGKANVKIESGKMVVEPIIDLLELRGSLKTNKKPLSGRKIRELFGEALARGEI